MINLKNRVDDAVFDWVQAHQWPLVAYAARDLTSFGGNVCVALFTLFAVVLLDLARQTTMATRLALAVAFVGVLVYVLKVAISRPCPLQPDPYQHWLGCPCDCGGFPVPHLPCMPSGHTTASTFLYGALAWIACQAWPEHRAWWLGCGYGLPVAIGITRVYLSAHWTTDVLAGFALGHLLLQGWRFLA